MTISNRNRRTVGGASSTLTHFVGEGSSLLRVELDGILGAWPDNTNVLSGWGGGVREGPSLNLVRGGQIVEANYPPGLCSQSMVSL